MTDAAKTSGKTESGATADSADTLVEVTAKMMASQASVFAAMAAWSMGMTGRMAGVMLDAIKDARDTTPEATGKPETLAQTLVSVPKAEQKPEQPAEKTKAKAAPKLKVVSGGRKDSAPSGAKTSKPVDTAATKKPVDPAATKKPVDPAGYDDLKQIAGIGPRLEKVLNTMGITRFEQIARMNGKALKDLDARLGLDNRIIRDDWSGKAKALLEG